MTKLWIDPPSGWRYGFPKIYDSESGKSIRDWLIAEGYPKKDIDYLGRLFYCRQWEVEDESRTGQDTK